MASARPTVQVIIIPEVHIETGEDLIASFIPYIKQTIPTDITKILNFSEGKGVPGIPLSFFPKLYYPKTDFIHMYEWSEASPDFAYMECIKYVLTIVTMVNAFLSIAYSVKEGIKDYTEFPGITGSKPPINFMELVYTQMYEGHKFVPLSDQVFKELDGAFRDLYNGRTEEARFRPTGIRNRHPVGASPTSLSEVGNKP